MWVTEMPVPGVSKLWQAGKIQSAASYGPRAKNSIYIFEVLSSKQANSNKEEDHATEAICGPQSLKELLSGPL